MIVIKDIKPELHFLISSEFLSFVYLGIKKTNIYTLSFFLIESVYRIIKSNNGDISYQIMSLTSQFSIFMLYAFVVITIVHLIFWSVDTAKILVIRDLSYFNMVK